MSSNDLIEQLRKATGVGRWTRAMLTAADRLEANDTEIAELRQRLEQAHADIAGLHDQLKELQIAQDYIQSSDVILCDKKPVAIGLFDYFGECHVIQHNPKAAMGPGQLARYKKPLYCAKEQ